MILIDTGPMVAMIDSEDDHHTTISAAVMKIRGRLITTDACFTEASYLIDRSAGWPGTMLLHRAVHEGEIEVIATDSESRAKAFAFMERFRDQPCDYADARLLAAAETTGIRRVFTIDGHFHAYRLTNGSSLEVIPG